MGVIQRLAKLFTTATVEFTTYGFRDEFAPGRRFVASDADQGLQPTPREDGQRS